MKTIVNRLKAGYANAFAALVVLLVLLGGGQAHAADPDASTIVTTASTTFGTVGTLVVSTVGFFIIVKIVKWIRK